MSAPFYVWDARTHEGFPANIEQAEYAAIHAQRETDISPALEAWIQCVKAFVLSDENKPYMADYVIEGAEELSARTVLEIEQMHIVGGDYFYKFLIESLREHQLAAYDSYRGIFICHEYCLPDYIAQQFSQEFARIIHPKDEVLDLEHLPRSDKQFEKLVNDWVCQQNFIGGKFEVKHVPFDQGPRVWPQLIREHEHFSDICGLSLSYRGGLQVNDFYHEIKIHALEHVTKHHTLSVSPEMVQFKQHNVCEFKHYIKRVDQLHLFLSQVKAYFDLIDPYLKSLSTLNHCVNHDDHFNFKDDYFSYKKARGYAPLFLALAKLSNDPCYEQLFEQWKNNVILDKGEDVFQDYITQEDGFLLQLNAIENI